MLVRIKSQTKLLHVYHIDKMHYYVRNKNGVIQGLDKTAFEIVPKNIERELKLNKILNDSYDIDETYTNDKFDYDIKKIIVKWSGSYPNLCSGEWVIMIDHMELPIPELLISSNMGTSGDYQSWHFDDNYSEIFETYHVNESSNDRQQLNSWIKYSLKSLEEAYKINLNINEKLINEIIDKISEQDFRSGSCGGCI